MILTDNRNHSERIEGLRMKLLRFNCNRVCAVRLRRATEPSGTKGPRLHCSGAGRILAAATLEH